MDALPHVKLKVAITAQVSPRSALLCLKFVEIPFYQVLRLVMTETLLTETAVRLLVLFKAVSHVQIMFVQQFVEILLFLGLKIVMTVTL